MLDLGKIGKALERLGLKLEKEETKHKAPKKKAKKKKR